MIKRVLLKDLIIKWLDYKRHYIKESTYSLYVEIVYKYITPSLKDKYVDEINEEIVQDLVFSWLEGKDTGICLKIDSAKNNIIILKNFLKYAKKGGYIDSLDMDIQYPKKYDINDRMVLDNIECDKIINVVRFSNNLKDIGILFTLFTGLRIGELCALKWGDIDFKNRIVKISKTIQRIYVRDNNKKYTKLIITVPKTKTSIREIPLSEILIDLLLVRIPFDKEAYILTGIDKYIEPRTMRSYFSRFLKKNNIAHIKFHGLRHTFATRCINLGADYKTVSEILGHASVNITLNLYVHPQMEQKRRCIELLEKGM